MTFDQKIELGLTTMNVLMLAWAWLCEQRVDALQRDVEELRRRTVS